MSGKKKISFRATLIELYSRVISLNKDDKKNQEVYWNDIDNLYPNRIQRIISNSPTACRAAKIMGKYISGKGLVNEEQDIVVNHSKSYKLSNVISIGGQNISHQGGVWHHIAYGFDDELNLVPKQLDVLDYLKCRRVKEDDEKHKGKVLFKDYCQNKVFGKTDEKEYWFYPFNKDHNVVLSQIKADYEEKTNNSPDGVELAEMLPYYRGQVDYLNITSPELEYAISPVDPVYNDADSEYRISLYENREVRTGFLGKTAVITSGLDDETSKDIDSQLKNWLGADGEETTGFFRLDVESAEDITKVLHVLQLKPHIDPKLFTEMKKELKTSILGAFNSIPEILVLSGSGALFGASGDTYKQAKIFYSEQTEDERWRLSERLTYLGFPCEIKPLIETDNLIQSV